MSFANDKLYKGYMRTKMPVISSHVKVREIVPHLSCLTLSDREEIEAKREISGNYAAMQHLLDCLRRRENWPEEFITALGACEHSSMAAEIQAEYDSLKIPSTPKAPSPPSTVVKVTVHSPPAVAPSAPAKGEEASSLTETTEAPGAPQIPVSQPKTPDLPVPQTSVPDPQNPSSPPASLDATQQSLQSFHPEPEENTEESGEFVGVVCGPGLMAAVETSCDVTAEAGSLVQSMETCRSLEPSEPPSASGVDSWEDLESVTLTQEKFPVQDSEPSNLHQPTQVQPTAGPPVDVVDHLDIPEPAPAGGDEEVCLSKPGVLLSVQPNTAAPHATPPTAGLPQSAFSGNISLQISDPESSGTHPQGPPGAPPQENQDVSCDLASFAEQEAQEVLEHVGHVMEEPSIQNLASPDQGTLGNAVHASQDQWWDEKNEGQAEIVVQSPSSSYPPPPPGGDGGDEGRPLLRDLQPQILNGKATPALAHEQVPACPQPAAVQVPQEPKTEPSVVDLSSRTKYIMAAVGIATCAMFVAWRRKN